MQFYYIGFNLKKAFTMIELIIVIAVVGVITAMVIPRFERDNLQEATEQVLKHIRYTQHLAMIDDVYDATQPRWFTRRWQIEFLNCGGYKVYSDTDMSGVGDVTEAARDPYSGLLIYTDNTCTINSLRDDEHVRIGDWYDITNIQLTGGCAAAQSIGYDNLGRPYNDINASIPLLTSTSNLINNDCNITLTVLSGESAVITIAKETGYARVSKWN